ncbi:O-antigen ligase family protein [Streptomyces zinciresistens]|uniref:O-antigen ligase family protein n=1 Tax=Streptomyces zinciresistens TaxID=1073330 RepID=UPI0002F5CFBD|nr:hypothetical protein [Streptomyces zinciresistens]
MASAAGPDEDSDRRNVSDAAGVAVLGACAAWSLISAALHDGRPEGVLLAILALAAGYAAGRIGGALVPVAAPAAGALAGLALTLAVPHLAPGPQFAAPLGHTGATAAVLTLSAGAACCAAWATSSPVLRLGLRVLAAAIAVTAAALGSTSGFLAASAVVLASLAAGRIRRCGVGIAGLAVTALAIGGLSWAIAARTVPGGLAGWVEAQLTRGRIRLWHDALVLARGDLGLGVGPGRFGDFGTRDAALPSDGRPHSALWQQAAEQGLVGVLLLAAVFGWLLFALWRTARPTPVALTAGAALTALAGIAAVGNALSFTAVTVGAGLLAGLATARPLADTPTPEAGQRPGGRRGAGHLNG